MSEWNDAVVVALGSNLKGPCPDTRALLDAAVARLRAEGMDVLAQSSWWRSAAWPDPDDPPYLNGVVVVRTDLDAHQTMAALGRIEEAFGRDRHRVNASRTLDLDLIAFGRLTGDLDGLILPHPRARDRRFVMGPLAEIAPDWICPETGDKAVKILAGCRTGLDAHVPPGQA